MKMKKFIIAIAFIVLGLYIANTWILGEGNENTMQGQSQRLGNAVISEMKTIEP